MNRGLQNGRKDELRSQKQSLNLIWLKSLKQRGNTSHPFTDRDKEHRMKQPTQTKELGVKESAVLAPKARFMDFTSMRK